MNRDLRDAIARAGFFPTQDAVKLEDEIRTRIGLTNRYETARLAIGRSLAESDSPGAVDRDKLKGNISIPGETLFGKEIDLWISAIVLHNQFDESASVQDFRQVVEAHWARGSKLLGEHWETCERDKAKFVQALSLFLPAASGVGSFRKLAPGKCDGMDVRLKVGPISRSLSGAEEIEFSLNSSGVSPHIALMGKTRTGKTTTGIQMLGQIVSQVEAPFLIIDPKGEFTSESALEARLGFAPQNCRVIEVGEESIPLDFLPRTSFGTLNLKSEAMVLRDSITLACKASGDVQSNLLRVAIERVLQDDANRDLDAIRNAYEDELVANGRKQDSIVSRLNEVTSLKCFVPELSIPDFFERSWVLSLNRINSEELKRLITLLVIDAFKSYILRLEDAPHNSGFRALRHVLVIDEARRILNEVKYQSLVDIVRQGASKGAVVILLSQDPSDFDGQADDFTTQLGTVVAFACAQTEKGLRKLQGVYGRKVQSQEFSDIHLPNGVAFCKLPGRQAERIRCWGQ